eukprot:gene12211-20409_t
MDRKEARRQSRRESKRELKRASTRSRLSEEARRKSKTIEHEPTDGGPQGATRRSSLLDDGSEEE